MAEYRYFTSDVRTGTVLEELPLTVDSFDEEVKGTGSLTGSLPLEDLGKLDWRSATIPRRTSLHVVRDGLVVWGGIIMLRRPQSGGAVAQITAETYTDYLSRRRIKSTLSYTGTDVFDIVRGIITQLQAVTGGNIRLQVTAGLAGWTQTITWEGYARAKALDEINRLSETGAGFEFTVSHSRDPVTGEFTPTLVLAAPMLGGGLPPILCEYPGNVVSYGYDEDGKAGINALTGVGKGDGAAQLLYEEVDTAGEIAAGYPIYEGELSLKEEDNLGRLTARTQADLVARLVDPVVPTVDLRGDADPSFGSFPLGVSCRLRATSPYHPAGVNGAPGLDVTRRVTGWTVKPSAAGRAEQVTLSLASGGGRVRAPMNKKAFARYLADLENRVRTMETAR